MSILGGRRILIVDDSRMIRHALVSALVERGASAEEAEDGVSGLQVLQNSDFDLVVTDVDMPHMDGYQLCERIRQDQRTRALPVVILTSRDQDQDIDRGFSVGANAYASKISGREHFIEVVEDVLNRIAFRRGQTVLLVEDSPNTRQMIARALEDAGFQVVVAEDGRNALDRLRSLRPNLILSGNNMPRLSGMALCRKVHRNESLANVPFVMMSRAGGRSNMQQAMQSGAAAFLIKPFNLDQLVLTLEQLLSNQFRLLLNERERLETESRMMLASITALAEALEARDAYTRGHSDSVAELAVAIATQMGADDEMLETLHIGGRLHDIGKIGVPDDILLKPGKLSAAEYQAIQRHPSIGAGILAPIPSLAAVLPLVEQHHEHFDGSGYPKGLKGDEIALSARITAVADTYDALTSDRPYRKGMLHAKAVSIIREFRGTQLCPQCVDAFIAWAEPGSGPAAQDTGSLPAQAHASNDPQRDATAKVLHPPFRRAKPKPQA